MDLSQIKVLSFDCYGTIIDWEPGLISTIKSMLAKHNIFISEQDILQLYLSMELKFQSGNFINYETILSLIIDEIGKKFIFSPTATEKNSLIESLKLWQPFPEAISALHYLKKFYQLAILSNTDKKLFAETKKQIPIDFDAVIISEELQCYKPSIIYFENLMIQLNVKAEDILHISCSMYHDVYSAQKMGIKTVYISRINNKIPYGSVYYIKPDLMFTNLYPLAALLLEDYKVEI